MLNHDILANNLSTHFLNILLTKTCHEPGDVAGYSFGQWSMTIHRCRRDSADYHSISLARLGQKHLSVAVFPDSYQLPPLVHYLSLPYVQAHYLVIMTFLRNLGLDPHYPMGHAFTNHPDGYHGAPHLSFRLPEPFRPMTPTLLL